MVTSKMFVDTAILIAFALALLPIASSSMDVGQGHRQLKKCSFDDTLGIIGIVIMSCDDVCGIDGLTFKASTIPAVCEFVTKSSNALNKAKALGCPNVNGNFFCKYGEVSKEVKKGNDDAMCDYCAGPPPTPKPPTPRPPTPRPPTPKPPTPCRRRELQNDFFEKLQDNLDDEDCPDDVADSFEPTVGPAPTPRPPTPRPPTHRPPNTQSPTDVADSFEPTAGTAPTPRPPTPRPPTQSPPNDSIASTSEMANDLSECSMELRALQLCAIRGCGKGCDIPGEITNCEGWQTVECHLMSSYACCPEECSNEIEDAIGCTTALFLGSGDMVKCAIVSSEICQDLVKSNGEAMKQTTSGATGPNGVDKYAWPRIALILVYFASVGF